MNEDDEFFVPENACAKCRNELVSPSGKYRLAVTPYGTKPGCWGYSRGEVYRGDEQVADVKRNYSSFPFSWIEHPSGHEYLVCGADYQGQTVIELDTGVRKDFLPDAAEKGIGFCWVVHRFYEQSRILVVEGCIWACPYEFRFYDFSDPMQGWPELETEGYIPADDRWPEIDSEGVIRCFDTENHSDSDGDSEEEKPKVQNAIALYKRDGLKLVKLSEWVSDEEQERRRQQEEASRKYDEWLKSFRSDDSLYLLLQETLKNPAFIPSEYESIGVTHEDWCPDFKGKERRMCKRIHKGEGKTIDLEWGVDTGPVKLIVYKDGKTSSTEFFEHSTDGMGKALAQALAVVTR